ncbi:MAG: R3H domain-containing nucleic acid-binding protein [Thermoanaerobaculia bacterium]
MTNSGRRFFSGNTLEQAVMQAASHYQIDPDEVAYRKIEKRHGFLKTRRGVVIDVDPDNPRRVVGLEILEAGPVETEAPDSPEMAEPREDETIFEAGDAGDEPIELAELGTPAEPDPEPEDDAVAPPEPLPEATGEMAEAALEAVGAVLEVAGLDLKADIFQGDGQLEIELSGPGQQELVADRGSLLLAIQHLLPRTIRGLTGRSVPCRVDSGNFHKMQEESLEKLAYKVAEEVKQEEKPKSLDPMNPAERRIIHLALADDAEVVTESHGRGFFKRVSIRPARRQPQGFDRYNR